jgi:GTP-binding protein
MKVTAAEFIKSAPDATHYPPEMLPEIAFLGRSNVGKSSLINSLLNRKGLARTSNTPGRTQLINFFLINKRFRFVDLPGYGFARVPMEIKRSWGEMVTDYLANRRTLMLSIHIVDSRHAPSQQDLDLRDWLRHHAKPHLTVATKSDKLSRNELQRNINRIKSSFGSEDVVAYSAITGQGRDRIWNRIEEAVSASVTP